MICGHTSIIISLFLVCLTSDKKHKMKNKYKNVNPEICILQFLNSRKNIMNINVLTYTNELTGQSLTAPEIGMGSNILTAAEI